MAFDLNTALWVVILIVVLSALYHLLKNGHKYWTERGVAQIKPNLFFGNVGSVLVGGNSLIQLFSDLYGQGRQHKYIGIYSFQRPILLVKDPELIKLILTKDFTYFQDRGIRLHNPAEPISDHLFSMEYSRWKILRRKLTPSFSTGKVKLMLKFVKECCHELNAVLENSSSTMTADDQHIENAAEVETKDLMARYTTDVISSCAFGLVTHSLSDPGAKFRIMGHRIFKQRFEYFLLVALMDTAPSLVNALKLRYFEKDVTEFFENCVANVVSFREKHNLNRGDFLDLLIAMKAKEHPNDSSEQQNAGDVEMTLSAITAQCFLFFAAGFETSSTTLSFCLFELAKDRKSQEKIQREIDSVAGNDQELTYDMLNDMNYLEMAVLETLRIYPPLYILSRKCTQDYVISGTNVTIEKGIEVIIPLHGLHHDSRHFENPETFNPDNFTETAKASRHSFTYLPFGEGPKICIGMRFGLMQIKLAIVTILRTFDISLSAKTKRSLTFVPITFVTNSREDILLSFSKRQKKIKE